MGFVGIRKKTTREALAVEIGYILKNSHSYIQKTGVAYLQMVWTDRRGNQVGAASIVAQTGKCTFIYQFTPKRGQPRDMKVVAPINWTDCNYGGRRPWFACPICGNRCRILYGGGGRHDEFACRTCQNLSYISQQRGHSVLDWGRAARRDYDHLLNRVCRARTDGARKRHSRRFERCRKRMHDAERYELRRLINLTKVR